MLKYYTQDNLAYLYLNDSIKVSETYTIDPLDISGLVNIDIDSYSHIFGIEIIPGSYIACREYPTSVRQSYHLDKDNLLIQFTDNPSSTIVTNTGPFYYPDHPLNGQIDIGLLNDKISYFTIYSASRFFPKNLLLNKDIQVVIYP